jgi:hypothetical protein
MSLADAGTALSHNACKLSLLSLHGELPDWRSADGEALAKGCVDAASSACLLVAAGSASSCRALRCALRAGVEPAVLRFAELAELVVRHDRPRPVITAATAAACEAAGALQRLPRDNRLATGRALVAAGARVKDAAREANGMCAPPRETEAAGDSDVDSCDYEEAATPEEARLVAVAVPLLQASFRTVTPLLRLVAEGGADAPAATLDRLLYIYQSLAEAAEEFTAALWPPQEPQLVLRHCLELAAAAEEMPAAAAAASGGGLDRAQHDALSAAVATVVSAAREVCACLEK